MGEAGAAFVESHLLQGYDHLSAQQFNPENASGIHKFLLEKLRVPRETPVTTNVLAEEVEEAPLDGSYVLQDGRKVTITDVKMEGNRAVAVTYALGDGTSETKGATWFRKQIQ